MKWGLALSAGSALGMANAGIIECLEEEGLRPDAIAASSMGAIIGALYALGHPSTVYRDLARNIRLTNIARPSERALHGGLHGGFFRQRLEEHLVTLIGNARIGDCRIPFFCVAGRVKEPVRWERIIQEGFGDYVLSCIEEYVFPPETPMMEAILASSAIPVVFSPVKIGADTFVDICNFGAVPVRVLRRMAHPDIIIATQTMPTYAGLARLSPPFLRDWLLYNQKCLERDVDAADLVISPKPVADFWRFDKFEAFIAAGRKATEEMMPRIKDLLKTP